MGKRNKVDIRLRACERASVGFKKPIWMNFKYPNLAWIYGLFDPREPQHIRYVGKTTATRLELRLQEHIETTGNNTHKGYWLDTLKDAGLLPQLKELEFCQYKEWEKRERFWIRKLKVEGHKLVNMTKGGDQTHGR